MYSADHSPIILDYKSSLSLIRHDHKTEEIMHVSPQFFQMFNAGFANLSGLTVHVLSVPELLYAQCPTTVPMDISRWCISPESHQQRMAGRLSSPYPSVHVISCLMMRGISIHPTNGIDAGPPSHLSDFHIECVEFTHQSFSTLVSSSFFRGSVK